MNSSSIPDNDINTNYKLYLLDPLSVIIKLAIISNKNIGVKIYIANNNIFVQEIGIFQSIVRHYYKTSKSDLQYLYNPIELACQYFLSNDYKKKTPRIKDLFICAQKGLTILAETYKSCSIVVHAINYYISLIGNHLNDHFNIELFKKDSFSIFYNKDILDKLYNIWDEEKIKLVLKMIDFLIKDDNATENVKLFETFMVPIDQQVHQLIMTTY